MFLIRFFFYAIITYFILKLVRVFTDPLTQASNKKNVPPTAAPNSSTSTNKNKPTLGDYVDFEEVKS